MVYRKATSSNLLNTWPPKRPVKAETQREQLVDKFLANLRQLEQSEVDDVATYQELNRKFMYYIDKKYRTHKDVVTEKGKEAPPAKADETNKSPEKREFNSLPGPNDLDRGGGGGGIRIPVVVFACNRISVSKCLDNLLKYRPNAHQFPIIVSQVSINQTDEQI